MTADDFLITRRTLARLDEWFAQLARPFLPLKMVELDDQRAGRFWWNFREENARTVMIGKAVRLISGIRAAMLLADHGYVTECGTVLRTVSDYTIEIGSLIDSVTGTEGPTTAQNEFVRQYFLPMAESPEAFASGARERWVARKEIFAGFIRWAAQFDKNSEIEKLQQYTEYLLMGYDKYVHGSYITAMELYNGETESFMLGGNDADFVRDIAKRSVASKLHEAITVFVSLAALDGDIRLVHSIGAVGLMLYDSGELS